MHYPGQPARSVDVDEGLEDWCGLKLMVRWQVLSILPLTVALASTDVPQTAAV